MTLIVMLMLLAAAGLLQSLFPSLMILGQARPPLLAAVVVFYALYFPAPLLAAAALLAGVLYDANSLLPLGSAALYYCMAGALIRNHQQFWAEGGRFSAAFLTALTAMGQSLLMVLIGLTGWSRAGGVPAGWMRHLFVVALLGAVAGVLTARLAGRLHRMTGTLEETVNS